MTVPTITLYSGVVPNRATQSTEDFTSAAITWTDYQAVTLIPNINTTVGAINTTAGEINDDKIAAAASASSAAASASSAASSAAFKGDWNKLTGSLPLPASVRHSGAFWQLLSPLADVAASEPTPSNADWAFVSGVRWTDLISTDAAVPANSQNNVQAIGGDVDITLPTFTVNDFLVVHCTANSDSLCRVLNPNYTIRGSAGSISVGDNLTLKAGDTAHLVYVSANILEIV